MSLILVSIWIVNHWIILMFKSSIFLNTFAPWILLKTIVLLSILLINWHRLWRLLMHREKLLLAPCWKWSALLAYLVLKKLHIVHLFLFLKLQLQLLHIYFMIFLLAPAGIVASVTIVYSSWILMCKTSGWWCFDQTPCWTDLLLLLSCYLLYTLYRIYVFMMFLCCSARLILLYVILQIIILQLSISTSQQIMQILNLMCLIPHCLHFLQTSALI